MGVNESAIIRAEVTVEDVVNPEDINIYRDLGRSYNFTVVMVLQTQ
jgi:predicted kinase